MGQPLAGQLGLAGLIRRVFERALSVGGSVLVPFKRLKKKKSW